MNKNSGKRIKMSLYTVGTLFRKGSNKKSSQPTTLIFTLLYSTLFLFHQSSISFPESARLTQKVSVDESAIQALSLLL